MDYIPNSDNERKEMLKVIGVRTVRDLFKDVSSDIKLKSLLKLPTALCEMEIKKHLDFLSSKNKVDYVSFLGGGSYNHYSPSIVNHITLRNEFYTSYTPYQPEISQGMLQSIYEFQSLICKLTGMEVSNASLYDGATALAESCIMAVNITKKKKIVVLRTVHPHYRETVKTYCNAHGFSYVEVGFSNGLVDISDLKSKVDSAAAVLVQSPNFFGGIEEVSEIGKIVHKTGGMLNLCIADPSCLGILKTPFELGVDIVVGEGQSFGIPMSYGGPYLGFIGTKMKFVRQVPGRIVGITTDSNGKRGFALTFQAREQHIRREKALSNICTNQALCALAATVYMSLLGKQGFIELASLNLQKAHYASSKFGSKIAFKIPFYNEFVIKVIDARKVLKNLEKKGILGGINLGEYYSSLKNHILICVTEMNTKEEIDNLIKGVS